MLFLGLGAEVGVPAAVLEQVDGSHADVDGSVVIAVDPVATLRILDLDSLESLLEVRNELRVDPENDLDCAGGQHTLELVPVLALLLAGADDLEARLVDDPCHSLGQFAAVVMREPEQLVASAPVVRATADAASWSGLATLRLLHRSVRRSS